MKHNLWRRALTLLLVIAMVASMSTPLSGLGLMVSASEETLVDYDALSMAEILALDKKLTWVFAGDSITHNASFTNGMNSYPEWFEQYLYTLGRQDAVINTAWGGAVVEDFLYYEDTPDKYGLKDNDGETGKGIENMITNYNPDVVFIKLGMNNRGTATDTFTVYYKKMLDAVYAEGLKNNKIPKIIVITPTPLGGDSLQGKEYFADKINQATADNVWRFQMILEDLVPEYNTANGRNMEFVDFMTGFTSEALVVGDAYAGTFFVDGSDGGLHPNQAAQYLMFNILCKSLGLYDETNPVFGFTYDDINNRAHYTDDTYISDYTGNYHSVNDVAAMIGEVKYDTFTAAFADAVEAGTATITLCKDVVLTSGFTVPADVNITITDDGNAHAITRGTDMTDSLFSVSGSLNLSGMLTVDGASVSTTVAAVTMNSGASVNVDGVTFKNNISTKSAGVISLGQGTLTVANAVFTGNTGTSGGAIYAGNNAVVQISDSAFASNKATGNGGAFYCENKSSVKLTGCTFEGNDAPSGSAIQIAADNGDYRLTLKNCDFIGNKTTYAIHAWRDAYITLDGCQFSGNSAGDVYFTNRTNSTDTTPDEYQFVYILSTDRAATGTIHLGNNGHPVRIGGTLAEGSNVKLNWASVPTGTAVQFDDEASAQANTGYLHLVDALSVDYMLSYEGAAATVIEKPQVTYVAQMGDVSYETYDALVEAIGGLTSGTEAAVTILSDVVAASAMTVPAGVTLTITDDGTARTIYRDASLTGSMFVVNGAVIFTSTSTSADVVNGVATEAASMLTIDGNGVAQTGSMIGVGSGAKVTVNQGVRFTNTTANSAAGFIALGGNMGATLTINGGIFDNHNNAALWAGSLSAWAGNTVTMNNAVIKNNSGSNIGALYIFSSCTIDNCVFTGNSGKYGGAINLAGSLTANITNSTFTNNTATSRGSAITLEHASAKCNISGCTFTNNTVNGADHAIKAQKSGSVVTVDGTAYASGTILTNAQATSVAAAAMLAEATEEDAQTLVSWTSLVDENNTWVIAGTQQVFGFQSLNAHRSIFRLMDGSVRCWWPYKDNRFVQARGTDVEALLASFEADTGMMADGQSIDVYVLIPQVNAVYEAGYTHSDELVAAYKTAVQAIADKAKAAGMTLVLWTPLANADDTVNGYITDYANAVREIGQADAANILTFDANLFMNEQMSANAALKNNWFAEGANISPLLANDIVRAFWSKSEMCDDALLNQVRDHNLRIGTDKQIHKGNFIADGIAYGVSVSGEQVTVDASAILAAYPEITNLRVAVLPAAGCGNYNEGIWNDYAVIENGTATFNAPWDNAAITVYGQVGEYTYRFKDVTLSVSVANDLSLPVYTTDSLTDLRVVGAPAFGFDAATTTYTVNLYQYQKNVQLLAQGGENLTVTVNGETVKVGQLSQQIAVSGKTATVTVTVTGGASDATYTLNLVKPDYPDIIITEVMEDPNYTSGLYELVELYNASGKDLNIKDYALGYKIESAYALIADDGSGNSVDGGLTPDQFTGDNHIFHAVSGTGSTYTSINEITKNSVNWTDAVEPETIAFPADSTMVVWIKQNWQDTKDTESYEDLIAAVQAAAGDATLVVTVDGVDTPVAPTADQIVMAEDPDGTDGGQETFSGHTSENSSENFYLENSGVGKRFWLFVTEAGAVRDDNGSITEAGDDIISAARWNRATAVAGLSTALIYNTGRGFALPYGEGTTAAADTKTTFGAIEYWQKPYDLEDVTVPGAVVTENETGITVTLTDDTDVRYLYLQIDADGDGTYETEIVKDLVLEAGVKNAGVSADQTSYTYTYADACVNYKGYVLDGNNNKTEFATPVTVAKIGDTKYGSLAEAIEAANAMESATIVLLMDVTAEETYTISGNVTITDNGTVRTIIRGSGLTGKIFDITGTLNLVGTAADMLKIDGNGVDATGQVISVGTGATVRVENAVLNGLHSGTYNNAALYFNTGSTVSITNTTISNTVGAVIYAQGAPAADTTYSFSGVTFSGNSAGAAGAVFNSAKNAAFTITGCTFENNAATGHGGVIYVDRSTYTITNSTFTGNKTTGGHGGAITVSANENSKVYITDSTFDSNSAAGHGGTIYARNGACTVEITGGTISNSTSKRYGGAIMGESNSKITVKNVSFSGNAATDPGEDIAIAAGGALTVESCSMTTEGTNVYLADASSVAPTFKATTANVTINSGYMKVAGIMEEGSQLTLTWNTVPGGSAIVFDSAAAAQANKDKIALSEAMNGQTLTYTDNSNVATFYVEENLLQDVYLASTGADSNAGTSEAPVLSLNKALELVKNGGTIHVVDSYTADSAFVWECHNKDVTITGGTLDFSALGNGKDFHQNDGVTYDNLTLTLGGWNMYFANGNRLRINENVTVTKTDTCIFGGGGYCYGSTAKAQTVYGTDVTILAGTWFKIYGGGRVADVDGDINLYVGGNVNAGHTVADSGSTQLTYGGGYNCNVSGDINLTVAGNAKMNFIYGGNELGGSTNYTVGGDITVVMSGGETYSIYGGHRISLADGVDGTQTGNISLTITGGTYAQVFGATRGANQVGNVTVKLLGGTITRRVYGGCYNDNDGSWVTNYHVIGNIDMTICGDVNITFSNSSSDRSIYGHSRYSGSPDPFADENSSIIFADQAAYDAYYGKLKAQDLAMMVIMGSTSAADNISIAPEIVANTVFVYEGQTQQGGYTTLTEALANSADGQYIKLEGDITEDVTLTRDLYIDLNGYTVSGTLTAGEYKVYGMDSTTDAYTCDEMGYFNMTTDAVVAHIKTEITGSVMRYMAIKTDSGYTFHRFYLGITKLSLKPDTDGVGYKAVFCGDEMVVAQLDADNAFGYSLQLGSYNAITRFKGSDAFVSGKDVTLRVNNYDVANFGETALTAKAILKLADGTVIESAEVSKSLRDIVEAVDAAFDSYDDAQKAAVVDFVTRYKDEMEGWTISNITG